jgi:hypothetical protein
MDSRSDWSYLCLASILSTAIFKRARMTQYPLPPRQLPAHIEALTGTTIGLERLKEVIKAYEPILSEIAKLRELDLAEVHPAIIFEPTAAYRRTL